MSNILKVILRVIGGYIKTKFAVAFSEGKPRRPSNEFCGHHRPNGLFTKLESGFLLTGACCEADPRVFGTVSHLLANCGA